MNLELELVQDLELVEHLRLELLRFHPSCFRLELVQDLELELEVAAVGRRCFLQKPFW